MKEQVSIRGTMTLSITLQSFLVDSSNLVLQEAFELDISVASFLSSRLIIDFHLN